MTLDELFAHARDRAADMFNLTGEVQPMWHAVAEGNRHMVLITPWSTPEEKAETVKALRAMFQEKHVRQLVFMCEAWTVIVPPGTTHLPEPTTHEDRREVLRVKAEDDSGHVKGGQYYILRPEHGPAKLSEFKPDPHPEATMGQFEGLLPQRNRTLN